MSAERKNSQAREAADQPRLLTALQISLRVIGSLSSRLAGKLAFELMVRPRRRTRGLTPHVPALMPHTIPYAGGELAAYRWPGEKRALLVHGWDSNSADFNSMIEQLDSAGWGGLVYDAPAHGRSDGVHTNFVDMGRALHEVYRREGPFEAVIGHSFGAAVALYQASALGSDGPDHLILGGAPSSLTLVLDYYADQLQLASSVRADLIRRIGERLGNEMAQYDLLSAAAEFNAEMLLVHDEDDLYFDPESARRLARAASSAQLLLTQGLGHRGWLQDETVLYDITRFLTHKHAPVVGRRTFVGSNYASRRP